MDKNYARKVPVNRAVVTTRAKEMREITKQVIDDRNDVEWNALLDSSLNLIEASANKGLDYALVFPQSEMLRSRLVCHLVDEGFNVSDDKDGLRVSW